MPRPPLAGRGVPAARATRIAACRGGCGARRSALAGCRAGALPALLSLAAGLGAARRARRRRPACGWSSPSESIAAAIAQAAPGAQVMVEPGEYREQLPLKDGVRVVSRVPRGATMRMPVGHGRRATRRSWRATSRNAELAGFRIVGDAATPLGTGILVERSHVTIVDVEILGASDRARRVRAPEPRGRSSAATSTTTPATGLVIRSGASPRISHSGFARNGVSERVSAPVVVEAGAAARLERNVFAGVEPEVFRALGADAARCCGRTGFPAFTRPVRPAPAAATAGAMMPSVYNRIGPYDIKQEIGRGGMAVVFLATDTRTNRHVALRSVPHYSGQDVLDAERRGAELQKQFCQVSAFVPEVYDHGSEAGYFYVAMEYLEGENLSQVIRRGPLPAARAVAIAIELCRFLEDARGFAWHEGGRDFRHLLHGDLTPVNVRIMADDRVKVLDFGIAKALSMSRKVTRNDFGNVAYLSPERLESGGEMDATDGFWAIGVMLYEMLRGAPPFSAPDTRRLERAIVARRPVPLPAGTLSGGPAGDRGEAARSDAGRSLSERRGDPRRISSASQAGVDTSAQKEGWPARVGDEPATRRMEPLAIPRAPSEQATRRTVPPPLPVMPARPRRRSARRRRSRPAPGAPSPRPPRPAPRGRPPSPPPSRGR